MTIALVSTREVFFLKVKQGQTQTELTKDKREREKLRVAKIVGKETNFFLPAAVSLCARATHKIASPGDLCCGALFLRIVPLID